MAAPKVLILGAGLSGLSAAYHLEQAGFKNYHLLERNAEAGGLARTETFEGFSFDHSIHILYTKDAYARDLICRKLLAENLEKKTRESYCYTSGVYTEYPYQANQHGLPVNVIIKNILGLLFAHCKAAQNSRPVNFEDWIYKTFGRGIAENFMIPYNRRQWAWDLKDMSYDWIAERVPMPTVKDVLLGAMKPPSKKHGPNREFWYPSKGGIESLVHGFLKHIPSEKISLVSNIVRIDSAKKHVVLDSGRSFDFETLISTLPLPVIIRLLGESVPPEIQKAAQSLKFNTVHTVNIGLKGENVGADKIHWVYFPDGKTIFHRVSFPHRFSSRMVPSGCSSIQAEISESVHKPLDRSGLIDETIKGLIEIGILKTGEAKPLSQGGRIMVRNIVTLSPAYIIYDLEHSRNVSLLKDYLEGLRIFSCGRFGDWEYLNMDHSILSGKQASETVTSSQYSGIHG